MPMFRGRGGFGGISLSSSKESQFGVGFGNSFTHNMKPNFNGLLGSNQFPNIN
jgi:hypothetical protein